MVYNRHYKVKCHVLLCHLFPCMIFVDTVWCHFNETNAALAACQQKLWRHFRARIPHENPGDRAPTSGTESYICRIMWQYREFNYSPSFVAYMRQWFGSALVQKMACPFRRQAIIWTNAGLLSIGPLGTYFSELLIKIPNFIYKNASGNIVCEMAAIFSRGIN